MRISAQLMVLFMAVSLRMGAAGRFRQGEPVVLIPGKPLVVMLESGEVWRCTVMLEAGSCARAVVHPRTNVLRVRLSRPDEQTLPARLTRRHEDTVISIVPAHGGRGVSTCAAGSSCEVRLARVAQATAGDAHWVQAEERLVRANASPSRPSAGELPRIIRLMEEGLQSYGDLGERLEASRLAREIAALCD
jgi:hypothetical protein